MAANGLMRQFQSSQVPILFLLFLNHSKHAGIFLCSLFSILHYGGSQVSYTYRTVSSIRMISLALTMTMSGRAEVSRISAGMVVGGVSVALISGKSAYSLSPGWRDFLRPSANISNALSCRQVYLPCERDTGHPFNICWTVGHGLSHRGHLASGLSLHHRKFKEVGSVSDPALSRNDSCPAGIPFWIRLQTLCLGL